MPLDAGDRARLRRIERELTKDDPMFVARFRSWPSSGTALPVGWSALPPWAAVVFLVGLTTWILTPVIGTVVVVVGGLWWLRERADARACAAGGRPLPPRRR